MKARCDARRNIARMSCQIVPRVAFKGRTKGLIEASFIRARSRHAVINVVDGVVHATLLFVGQQVIG